SRLARCLIYQVQLRVQLGDAGAAWQAVQGVLRVEPCGHEGIAWGREARLPADHSATWEQRRGRPRNRFFATGLVAAAAGCGGEYYCHGQQQEASDQRV